MVSEARVTELLAAGDVRGAAVGTIQLLGPQMLGYLRSILRDEGDVSDAFSVFAENVWRGLSSFRHECSLTVWAYKLAWTAALNVRDTAWKRLGRRLETTEASELAEELRSSTVVLVERQHQGLDALRETLTPEEQTLLALRVDQELSWAEVATVLGANGQTVDPATIRKRFERLKDRLATRARELGLLA